METQVTGVTTALSGDNKEPRALVELESGARIICKHAVVSTGGLFQMPQLCGILTPCYSYLVHVPILKPAAGYRQVCEYSSNFFTWGFPHDWCWTNGKVRCSGEDHFSAYKPPLDSERCANLVRWTQDTYNDESQPDLHDIPQQYGVYSETPDSVPLVGYVGPESRVCLQRVGPDSSYVLCLTRSGSFRIQGIGQRAKRQLQTLLCWQIFPFAVMSTVKQRFLISPGPQLCVTVCCCCASVELA